MKEKNVRRRTMVVKDRMTPEKEQRGAPNTGEGIGCVVSQFLLGFSLLSIVLYL